MTATRHLSNAGPRRPAWNKGKHSAEAAAAAGARVVDPRQTATRAPNARPGAVQSSDRQQAARMPTSLRFVSTRPPTVMPSIARTSARGRPVDRLVRSHASRRDSRWMITFASMGGSRASVCSPAAVAPAPAFDNAAVCAPSLSGSAASVSTRSNTRPIRCAEPRRH